ncbi:hypothetical protein FQA39_LY00503 [Lamprigera yunnana]|nr:hypothetical protein FQA39_LY00503 [Lamprigera yunnana]
MSESGIIRPGQKIKTVTNLEEVEEFVRVLYDLPNFTIVELNGYDDKNYKISIIHEDEKVEEYTFKIMNWMDSKNIPLVEAQNDMMLFLNDKGIVCPKPINNVHGKYYSMEKFASGEHVVRLLNYIPGTILHQIQPTSQLYYEIGRYVAILDDLLKSFYHPVYETRKSIWMLDSIPLLRQFVFAEKCETRKKLIERVILEFEERVLKVKRELEQGIIHGDFNEQNILTERKGQEWNLKGILDFGDTQHSCYLFEFAIAATYMMVMNKSIDAVGHLLGGYSTIRAMPDKEFSLLKTCIAARLCQSYTLGIYTCLLEPDNPYFTVAAKEGWRLLEILCKEPEESVMERWKSIKDSYTKIE